MIDTAAGVVDVLGQVLLATLGVVGLVMVTTTAGLVLLVRRARRSRRLTRMRLVARSAVGPAARLARLRLDLDRSMAATTGALGAAHAAGRPVGDLPVVVAQLSEAASALDERLRDAEREPDPGLRRSLTAGLVRDVREQGRLAAEVRTALRPAQRPELERARETLTIEREALRAWDATYRRTARRADA